MENWTLYKLIDQERLRLILRSLFLPFIKHLLIIYRKKYLGYYGILGYIKFLYADQNRCSRYFILFYFISFYIFTESSENVQ